MVKTIKISEELHEELTREKGFIQSAEGKNIVYEEMIERLLKFWRKKR